MYVDRDHIKTWSINVLIPKQNILCCIFFLQKNHNCYLMNWTIKNMAQTASMKQVYSYVVTVKKYYFLFLKSHFNRSCWQLIFTDFFTKSINLDFFRWLLRHCLVSGLSPSSSITVLSPSRCVETYSNAVRSKPEYRKSISNLTEKKFGPNLPYK
jgi:hypothetical protein